MSRMLGVSKCRFCTTVPLCNATFHSPCSIIIIESRRNPLHEPSVCLWAHCRRDSMSFWKILALKCLKARHSLLITMIRVNHRGAKGVREQEEERRKGATGEVTACLSLFVAWLLCEKKENQKISFALSNPHAKYYLA